MPPYIVEGTGSARVLMVVKANSHRFRFYNIVKDKMEDVKFQRAGSKIVAVVGDCVMVYKKPNAHQFHKEYMAHNARAMWCGLPADSDRLLDNMLEYVEAI